MSEAALLFWNSMDQEDATGLRLGILQNGAEFLQELDEMEKTLVDWWECPLPTDSAS